MEQQTMQMGNPELKASENVGAGVLGAFLLSLVGGLATVVLLQLDIIAGLAGFLSIVLGYWGYRKFAKVPYSRKGLWLSIAISVVVQLFSYYLGWTIAVLREVGGQVSFLQVFLNLFPAWKAMGVLGNVIWNAVVLLGFMAFASIFLVINTLRQIKNAEAAKAAAQQTSYYSGPEVQ